MKTKRKIIEIDENLCDGCGQCVPSCAEGAIEIVDGKARLVQERYCDGLGACLGECPTGALKIVEREAEEFDEDAVRDYLEQKKDQGAVPTLECGCPSEFARPFTSMASSCEAANRPTTVQGSMLSHWPIQLRLVGASPPFLKDAHLLIASDCTVAAYPAFHQEFLPGKVLLMGCPKFDDIDIYRERLVEIFKTNSIQSVTCVVMEVPCCGGMPRLIEASMHDAAVSIPTKIVTVGIKGWILGQK